jgi:hypothetical protein
MSSWDASLPSLEQLTCHGRLLHEHGGENPEAGRPGLCTHKNVSMDGNGNAVAKDK